MKLFGCLVVGKDGGQDSTVDGVMFEIKGLFSFGILRFKDGSRDAFHSHAFNCWSLLLRGVLLEEHLDPKYGFRVHAAGDDILTYRTDIHRVSSLGTSYVFTVRGPWKRTWVDAVDCGEVGWFVDTLTNGRRMVGARGFATRSEAAEYAMQEAKRAA